MHSPCTYSIIILSLFCITVHLDPYGSLFVSYLCQCHYHFITIFLCQDPRLLSGSLIWGYIWDVTVIWLTDIGQIYIWFLLVMFLYWVIACSFHRLWNTLNYQWKTNNLPSTYTFISDSRSKDPRFEPRQEHNKLFRFCCGQNTPCYHSDYVYLISLIIFILFYIYRSIMQCSIAIHTAAPWLLGNNNEKKT